MEFIGSESRKSAYHSPGLRRYRLHILCSLQLLQLPSKMNNCVMKTELPSDGPRIQDHFPNVKIYDRLFV